MKGLFNKLQNLGRTFMLPIALLPIAGLFLGLGSAFTNESLIANYGLENIMGPGTVMNGIFMMFVDVGDIVFGNLALLFAISVAFGLAKDRKEVAAMSAVVGYLTMYAAMTSWIHNLRNMEQFRQVNGLVGNVLGFEETFNMGVFGGIIIGLLVSYLHNKYYRVKFPDALSFFQGTHFVPIISTVGGTALGILFAYVWPIVGTGIANFGEVIASSGAIGSFLYGYIYRALIPFGLHHVFYLPFWQTALGGSVEVAGEMVHGAQNIVFAQLAANEAVLPEAAKYFSFQFPLMIGGWPAAALAMYHSAKKENRSEIKGLLFGSSITSILTGITEPIEFTTLFASPFLFYGIHSVLAGFSVILVEWLGAGVGLTFSGGLTDFIIYGILPGNDITKWTRLILPIIIWFVLYYVIFRFAIEKFDLDTPGRKEEAGEARLRTKDEYRKEHGINQPAENSAVSAEDDTSIGILEGLGGYDNLEDFTNCATRLRVTVKDGSLVDQARLRSTGSAGIMQNGQSVQVIYGTKVEGIAGDLRDFIQNNPEAAKQTNQGHSDTTSSIEDEEKEPKDSKDSKDSEVLKSEVLSAPMNGEAVSLEQVEDEVFSSGMMGQGAAILPSDGAVCAPVNGEVTMVMESGHAIGLTSEQGAEVLIHVGIDTVNMNGEGFTTHVKQGDQVKVGDLLLEADLEAIKEANYPTDTMVIVTNTPDYSAVELMTTGEIKVGDELVEVHS